MYVYVTKSIGSIMIMYLHCVNPTKYVSVYVNKSCICMQGWNYHFTNSKVNSSYCDCKVVNFPK